MLAATKIAEVRDKVQPVLLEEVPQLKLVVINLQHNSCAKKGRAIRLCLFLFYLNRIILYWNDGDTSKTGGSEDIFGKTHAVEPEPALEILTLAGDNAMNQEHKTGSIKDEKLTDMIVFDRNLF